MKVLPIKSNRHTLTETTKLINEIYEDAETSFDEKCVNTYEVIMDNENILHVIAIYDKVKVTPPGTASFYWPILQYNEEFNREVSLKIIQKLGEKA